MPTSVMPILPAFHFFVVFPRGPSSIPLLYCCFFCFHIFRATVAGGVTCPAEVSTRFFPREEHRYPSPLPFQRMGPADVAADPLAGAVFAEDVRTHIPRAWAVDDDEDYVDVEVRQGRLLDVLIGAETRAFGFACALFCYTW